MSFTGQTTGQTYETTAPEVASKRRLGAWLLPLGILAGFVLLFALLFRDRLLPAKEVLVFPAVGIEEKSPTGGKGRASTTSGDLLFQASGWIEPDPLPIKATALTDGIVEEVHVLEGELVQKGDLLATLIGVDTRIERDLEAAKLADLKASFDAHCTGTQIAIQKMEVEKASLAIAEANAAEAENKLDRYERMSKGSITEDERVGVQFDRTRSLAEVDAAEARVAGIAEDLNRIAYEVLAIQSRIKAAEARLEAAELAHSRTKITAPANGRILKLMAAPGQKKMAGMDSEDSSTIAILYSPENLQVRVDVPLADAAGLGVGQRARIRCNLLPDVVFEGEVTRVEGSADIQRNTLQAKVRIEDPSEKLRPEMLCRVEFFETSPAKEKAEDSGTAVAVYVPESAVISGAVWVCDSDSLRAERRVVETSLKREDLTRVDSGIRPGEWVVTDSSGLKAGQRLQPVFPD